MLSKELQEETTTDVCEEQIVKASKKKEQKSITYYINKIDKIHSENIKDSQVKRLALFPVLDETSYSFYQKQETSIWSSNELDFVADQKWYDNASKQHQRIIDTILAFFLSGDGAISQNIVFRFLLECGNYEEMAFFISQLHIELVHADSYGLAAFTFKRNDAGMTELIELVENAECVKAKLDFMQRWSLADKPRYQRLVAFACAEGIHFATIFAIIFWYKSKGWFPNFILANELIAKDESLHRDWGCYLFEREINKILSKFEKDSDEYNTTLAKIKAEVYEIVDEAVNVEFLFADHILNEAVDDLNATDLKTYAKLIADNLLVQLSFSSTYRVTNPFTWLDEISFEVKGNFYEVRIGAYKNKSLTDLNWKKRAGLIEENKNVYVNPEEVDF